MSREKTGEKPVGRKTKVSYKNFMLVGLVRT